MILKTRFMLVILALAAASLACNLPLQDQSPGPVFSPPTETQAPPGTLPTSPATLTLPATLPVDQTAQPPADTAAPLAPTITGTALPTQTLGNSPTPPPTVTKKPAASTTATRTPGPSSTPAVKRVVAVAPLLKTAPKLDGIWSEWPDSAVTYPAAFVTFGRENWTGAADLEGSYRAAYDSKNLYLAVKVKDDVYVQNATGANLYEGDSLEVLLDSNLFGDLNNNSLSGDDYQLGISPGNPDVKGTREAYLWFPRSLAGDRSQVKIASVRQSGVTRYEVAIPWSVFGVTPSSGMRLGFVLSVSDNDNPNANQQQTLVSSVSTRVLVDPTTWGELRLK